MIAPTSEAIDAGPQIESMGRRSLSLWPQWLAELPVTVFYRDDGSLLLWHREDAGEAVCVQRGARLAPCARKPQTLQAVAIALTEKGSSATEKHLSRMACSPMPELSYIVVAWAPSTVGHSCAVFAARSSVSMRRDRTALHVCGCCTRATRCTSFRTPKEDWLSGRPASRAMIIRLFPCAALLSS
jgi:hypothetical protein